MLRTEDPEFVKDNFRLPDNLENSLRLSCMPKFKTEDMVNPQDQTIIEWKDIEFFVPATIPRASEIESTVEATDIENSLLVEDQRPASNPETGLPKPSYM